MAVSEKHYTPKELAQKWHLSVSTIRRLCDEHGGVLVIDRPETMNKRGYRTIRIPQSTADEIYRRHFMPRAKRNQGGHWSQPALPYQPIAGEHDVPRMERPARLFPAPEIRIFTRHDRDCKHRQDQFFQGCDCSRSFRFKSGHTLRSGTRSWKEAEELRQRAILLVVQGVQVDAWCAVRDVRSQVLLSVTEAAMCLGCTEQAIRQRIDHKELCVVRFGRFMYLNRADLTPLPSLER